MRLSPQRIRSSPLLGEQGKSLENSPYVVAVNNGIGGVSVSMAKTLKSQGRVEIANLVKRVRRQLTLERISEIDATYIVGHLLEADERIVQMSELDEQGKQEEIVE
jgi:hypothetical protein